MWTGDLRIWILETLDLINVLIVSRQLADQLAHRLLKS